MLQSDLKTYKKRFQKENLVYHTDIFTKFIWGEMGEDVASIKITVIDDIWNLSYIRTQNGEPYFGSGFVSIMIDEYEKEFDDETLMTYLIDRGLCDEFETFVAD